MCDGGAQNASLLFLLEFIALSFSDLVGRGWGGDRADHYDLLPGGAAPLPPTTSLHALPHVQTLKMDFYIDQFG